MEKNSKFIFFSHSLILLFFLTQTVFPQILSELEFVKMDTLLMQKKFNEINNLFTEKEKLISEYKISNPDTSEFIFIKDRYLKLANYFKEMETYNENDFDKRIKQFKNFEESFNIETVGKKSTNYYKDFLENSSNNKKLLALKNYNLAHFYKTLHVRKINKNINKIFNQVEQNIKNKNFKSANILLNSLELESGMYLKREPNHTKYDYLKEITNDEINKIEIEQNLYHQEYETSYLFVFSLGAQFVPFSSVMQDDQTWYFVSTRGNIYNYDVDKIELSTSYSFFLDFGYYSISNLKFGLNMEYGKNKSSSFTTNDFESSFDISFYSFQLSADYLFRKKIGLRPYVGIGLKDLNVTREKFVTNNSFIAFNKMTSEEKNYNLLQVLLNFGTEYIYSKNSNVVMQIFISPYFNLYKSKLIGAFGINFGVKIGYAI